MRKAKIYVNINSIVNRNQYLTFITYQDIENTNNTPDKNIIHFPTKTMSRYRTDIAKKTLDFIREN